MADTYLVQHADTTVPSITIQPGTVDGPGQLNQNTDLLLPGQGLLLYGQMLDQDLLHLLENFASPQIGPGTPSASVIAQPQLGQLWFNKTDQHLYVFTSGGWSVVSATAGITQTFADARYVFKAGDTMTGALVIASGNLTLTTGNVALSAGSLVLHGTALGSPPSGFPTAASKLYFDNSPSSYLYNYTYSSGGATYNALTLMMDATAASGTQYYDFQVVGKSNAVPNGVVVFDAHWDDSTNVGTASVTGNTTLNGNLAIIGSSLNIDMGGNQVHNVADPTHNLDAANMQWVNDQIIASTGGGLTVGTADARYVKLDGTNTPMSGALSMGSHQIHTVTDPTAAQDAATKNYVDTQLATLGGLSMSTADARYLRLAGGTMSGNINMNSNPISGVSALTTGSLVVTGTSNFGGAMSIASAALFGQLNVNNQSVIGVITPVNPQDAVNKAYVDAAIGAGAHSFTANGYYVLPGGLYVQWGHLLTGVSEQQYSFAFPIAFPHACLVLIPVTINNTNNATWDIWGQWVQNTTTNTTGVIYLQWDGQPNNNSDGYAWIALGY